MTSRPSIQTEPQKCEPPPKINVAILALRGDLLYVITPEKFTNKFYYYLLIFIELYFSNFRPLTCFSVTIPEAV